MSLCFPSKKNNDVVPSLSICKNQIRLMYKEGCRCIKADFEDDLHHASILQWIQRTLICNSYLLHQVAFAKPVAP